MQAAPSPSPGPAFNLVLVLIPPIPLPALSQSHFIHREGTTAKKKHIKPDALRWKEEKNTNSLYICSCSYWKCPGARHCVPRQPIAGLFPNAPPGNVVPCGWIMGEHPIIMAPASLQGWARLCLSLLVMGWWVLPPDVHANIWHGGWGGSGCTRDASRCGNCHVERDQNGHKPGDGACLLVWLLLCPAAAPPSLGLSI